MSSFFGDIVGSAFNPLLTGGNIGGDWWGGLLGGSGSAPTMPNPANLTQEQLAVNKQAAQMQQQLNMVDQTTPYGSVTYGKTGPDIGTGEFDSQRYLAENPDASGYLTSGSSPEVTHQALLQHYNLVGKKRGANAYFAGSETAYDPNAIQRYQANQTLNPEQQAMLDNTNKIGLQYGDIANQQLGRVSDTLSKPIDFGELGGQPTANMDVWAQAQQGMMDRQQPFFQRDEAALRTQLENQGIRPGSEAYPNAMMDFNRGKNDFALGASNQAMGQMSQMYGLQGNEWDRKANAMAMERSTPINEMAAFMNGSAVQNPNFIGTPQAGISAPDQMGATYANYQSQVDQRNFDKQQQNAMIGGLAGTAGTMAMMSDRRMKSNIKQEGVLPNGLKFYSYDLLGERRMGLMADEVKEVFPDAVVRVSGIDHVHYGMVL